LAFQTLKVKKGKKKSILIAGIRGGGERKKDPRRSKTEGEKKNGYTDSTSLVTGRKRGAYHFGNNDSLQKKNVRCYCSGGKRGKGGAPRRKRFRRSGEPPPQEMNLGVRWERKTDRAFVTRGQRRGVFLRSEGKEALGEKGKCIGPASAGRKKKKKKRVFITKLSKKEKKKGEIHRHRAWIMH